jgi:hypothetical protein
MKNNIKDLIQIMQYQEDKLNKEIIEIYNKNKIYNNKISIKIYINNLLKVSLLKICLLKIFTILIFNRFQIIIINNWHIKKIKINKKVRNELNFFKFMC